MFVAETKVNSAPSENRSSERAVLLWNRIVDPVQPFLKSVVKRLEAQIEVFDPEIAGYVRYALTNQGKQLRPSLIALSGAATGGVHDDHVDVAVIIEMVHLATLVHDDVMDKASIRRRRPTLAANWGNQTSVLVGDCLFARALELAAEFPTPDICRAVARAANTVCSGEILQNKRQRQFESTRSDYFRILEMKTAELFALSCALGAGLNRPEAPPAGLWRRFGLCLGTAYQIYDDCVDLFGSESKAGKSLGTDLAGGKVTLPMLYLWERANDEEREIIQTMLDAWDPKHLSLLHQLLDRHDALEASQQVVTDLLDRARQQLANVPNSSSRDALIQMLEFMGLLMNSVGIERGR